MKIDVTTTIINVNNFQSNDILFPNKFNIIYIKDYNYHVYYKQTDNSIEKFSTPQSLKLYLSQFELAKMLVFIIYIFKKKIIICDILKYIGSKIKLSNNYGERLAFLNNKLNVIKTNNKDNPYILSKKNNFIVGLIHDSFKKANLNINFFRNLDTENDINNITLKQFNLSNYKKLIGIITMPQKKPKKVYMLLADFIKDDIYYINGLCENDNFLKQNKFIYLSYTPINVILPENLCQYKMISYFNKFFTVKIDEVKYHHQLKLPCAKIIEIENDNVPITKFNNIPESQIRFYLKILSRVPLDLLLNELDYRNNKNTKYEYYRLREKRNILNILSKNLELFIYKDINTDKEKKQSILYLTQLIKYIKLNKISILIKKKIKNIISQSDYIKEIEILKNLINKDE